MRKLFMLGVTLALAGNAFAAPNVTNVTQKGSLLVFPDIRVDLDEVRWRTLIRIQNDGNLDVDVKCYWMDGNKNRVDFVIPLTRNQPAWFDAGSGNGSFPVNRFPSGPANGFENPFLGAPDGPSAYGRGMLACWAVDAAGQQQVKWNHLSGTATLFHTLLGAYEYSAYAFFVPTGLDQEPVGVAGTLNLNGVEYDSCPLYQIDQFTPGGGRAGDLQVDANRLALVGCTLNLQQDWTPVWTKLQFDVWNEDEIKFTGAFECSDSWHETDFRPGTNLVPGYRSTVFDDGFDAAGQNFDVDTIGTSSARYRVQGVKSTQCDSTDGTKVTQAVGLLAVRVSSVALDTCGECFENYLTGTTLTNAGKFTGRIVWNPAGPVPEGGIR